MTPIRRSIRYALHVEVCAMNTKLAVVVAVAGLLGATRPAAAHHAFAAEFDAKKAQLLDLP